jgi:hypothetical protein
MVRILIFNMVVFEHLSNQSVTECSIFFPVGLGCQGPNKKELSALIYIQRVWLVCEKGTYTGNFCGCVNVMEDIKLLKQQL